MPGMGGTCLSKAIKDMQAAMYGTFDTSTMTSSGGCYQASSAADCNAQYCTWDECSTLGYSYGGSSTTADPGATCNANPSCKYFSHPQCSCGTSDAAVTAAANAATSEAMCTAA